jgi:hypothetical protein
LTFQLSSAAGNSRTDEFPGRQRSVYRVDCDVGHLANPDLRTVAVLARAQLDARRRGTRLRFRNASPALRELIVFAGLEEVLPLAGRLGGQAEEREEPVGVEEERELGDAAV